MRLMDGGISIPSVPPAAIEPAKRLSPYPYFLAWGSATVVMVAAVATLDPEVAANMADVPIFACIRPPGNQESHLSNALYVRSAIPA